MAFNTTVNDLRADDLRFRGIDDRQIAPLRSSGEFGSGLTPSSETRGQLFRRFTTESLPPTHLKSVWDTPRTDPLDLGAISEADVCWTWKEVGNVEECANQSSPGQQRVRSIIQQKQMQVELRRQQMYAFQAQQRLLEDQNRQEEEEMLRMAQSLDRIALNGSSKLVGQSEPTTPPEYRDSLFGRTKALAGAAPQGLATPPSSKRSDQQQLITPPAEEMFKAFESRNSGPNSRRNSDEQEDGTPSQRGFGNGLRRAITHNSGDQSLGSVGIPRFGLNTDILFDEDSSVTSKRAAAKSPQEKKYLQMMNTNGNFPILTASGPDNKLSASSAALDLAHHPSDQLSGQSGVSWNPLPSVFNRTHRPAQHSLPVNAFPLASTTNTSSSSQTQLQKEGSALPRNERSVSFQNSNFSENMNVRPQRTENTPGHIRHMSMPRLQASYSTNDIPTMRNTGYSAAPGSSGLVGQVGNPQQMNHGRTPDRMHHGREQSFGERSVPPQMTTTFGPALNNALQSVGGLQMIPLPVAGPFGAPSLSSPTMAHYGGYGSFNALNAAGFQSHTLLHGRNEMPINHHQHQQMHGGPNRNMHKRSGDGEANRFANVKLESLVNEIYSLCKDQHGCRYLQKKLEEGNPAYVEMIFRETHAHVVELMTDPFGNYLCQKLLEFTNNEQRTVLVQTAAPRLVTIALNQHGTRALQKMIESLSTSEQINTVINALKSKVVELIQDLNGNHVIQKCLNRLKAEDAQFIFDAVGENCIPVGTHRHGCCVLQRCIDHASGPQKAQLIQKITANSLDLVQDAFGNYVVQYILDLGEAKFSEPVIMQFRGQISDLAKQKFSSNVIEKCIRVAEPATKKLLIDEMVVADRIEELLRDCYANYVIQTAIDYADPATRAYLADKILPLLPTIRNFPYGRRIQSKLQPSMESKPGMYPPGTAHSRSNSYSQGGARPNLQSPPRGLPTQQHSAQPQIPGPSPASFPSQSGPGQYIPM